MIIFLIYRSLISQQIDFGEETGPRTVVSGLVNYVPIEKMQDKWLVGVVRRLSLSSNFVTSG